MIDDTYTTGQVAKDLGLSEAQLSGIMRRRPELSPALVRGRRRWSGADVDRVRSYLTGTTPPASVTASRAG